MIPLESPVPEIGPAGFGERGEETYPWDSACGPVAKAPDKPPTPTGYAPLLDSTEGPDSTAKGRDPAQEWVADIAACKRSRGFEQPTGGA